MCIRVYHLPWRTCRKSLSRKKLLKATTIAILKWTLGSFIRKNDRGQLGDLQSELVNPLWPTTYTAIVGKFIVCQWRTSVTWIFLSKYCDTSFRFVSQEGDIGGLSSPQHRRKNITNTVSPQKKLTKHRHGNSIFVLRFKWSEKLLGKGKTSSRDVIFFI